MQIPHTYFQNESELLADETVHPFGSTNSHAVPSKIKLYLLTPEILEAVENRNSFFYCSDLPSDFSEDAIDVLQRLGLRSSQLAIFDKSGEEYARDWIYRSHNVPRGSLKDGVLGLMETSDGINETEEDNLALVRLDLKNECPATLRVETIGLLPRREERISCFSRLYNRINRWWNPPVEEKDDSIFVGRDSVPDCPACSISDCPAGSSGIPMDLDKVRQMFRDELRMIGEEMRSLLDKEFADRTGSSVPCAPVREQVVCWTADPIGSATHTTESRKLRKFSKKQKGKKPEAVNEEPSAEEQESSSEDES